MNTAEFTKELKLIDGQYFAEEISNSVAYMRLYRLTEKVIKELEKDSDNSLPDSIQEALNSGDGVYRP